MPEAFVPKSRRVRFTLTLHIHDLNNVPLVSGTSFIKWHLPSSTAAEHRGRTPKCAIKDHRVLYDHVKTIPVRLTVGRDGMLQLTEVHFEVVQEYSTGGRAETIRLGEVKLNLAEYCSEENAMSPQTPGGGDSNGGDGSGVVRRYLMQESKINSTLKIGIHMKYMEGTRDYYAPALRTAPVFGGIAGIISSGEPASTTHGVASHSNGDLAHDANDMSALPNLSTTNRELGEMQDMYRRTLAAYWASQPGELKADECIEDIFAGGDGWGKHGRPPNVGVNEQSSQPGSGTSTPNPDGEDRRGGGRETGSSGHSKMGSGSRISMGGGTSMRYGGRHASAKTKAPRKGAGEIDEFDIRDDLKSWRISEAAYS